MYMKDLSSYLSSFAVAIYVYKAVRNLVLYLQVASQQSIATQRSQHSHNKHVS